MPRYKYTKTGFMLDTPQEDFIRERIRDGTLPPNYNTFRPHLYDRIHTANHRRTAANCATSTSQTEVRENEDFKSKILFKMENKLSGGSDDDDSGSKTDQEDSPATTSSLGQSHSPNSPNSESATSNFQTPKDIESCSTSSKHSNAACDRVTDDNSSSSAIVEVKSEKPGAENSADSPPSQDLKRSRRNSKRKRDFEDHCPVCSLTIRGAELESHFQKEVENLSTIARNIKSKSRRVMYRAREGFRCGINLAFLKARGNREDRVQARREKYKTRHTATCPVCRARITGSDEEINEHVFDCFREDDESDIEISVSDHEDTFEEYEIGNETRVRAISLVPGGHRALHGYSSRARPTNDEDVGDLNVDGDDASAFGEPQYTELDIIHNYPHTSSSSDKRENEQLRKAVSDPSAKPHVIEGSKWTQNYEIQNEIDKIVGSCAKDKSVEDKSKDNEGNDTEVEDATEKENPQNTESDIISSLKKKIMDLENQKNIKCLICLESYTRPVVSTTCWHVHCEECWLVSMGVKKLCPQCNMIVFPTDLRRIYI